MSFAFDKQSTTQAMSVQRDVSHSNKIILSYVQVYLQIGNINKAREQFQKIEDPESNPSAMITLAELRAAEGDTIGAQQAFLFSLAYNQLTTPFHHTQVSPDLLDFFCQEKKWPALDAYAAALIDTAEVIDTINSTFSKLGVCFFNGQRWQEADDLFKQLNFALPVQPFSYLALARNSIEQEQYSAAKSWIAKFEETKTTIDAKILWTAFEVYRALGSTDIALQMAEHLRALFPNSQYVPKLQMLVQPAQINPIAFEPTARSESELESKSVKSTPKKTFHTIRSGETLYQLSKLYDLSIADLLLWNPDLVIEDIALGTRIRISPSN
jgi:Tfp pilus assembly protein PilF